jgi:hypothetical protein
MAGVPPCLLVGTATHECPHLVKAMRANGECTNKGYARFLLNSWTAFVYSC